MALLAAGLTLDEIPYWRDGTLEKYTPSGEYVVVKFSRWAFEKFKGIEDKLGTQMRAVGEQRVPSESPVVVQPKVPSVLIVDDDRIFRHVIRKKLEKYAASFRVLTAEDGLDAVAKLEGTASAIPFIFVISTAIRLSTKVGSRPFFASSSRWPDLFVAAVIAGLNISAAVHVVQLARSELQSEEEDCEPHPRAPTQAGLN